MRHWHIGLFGCAFGTASAQSLPDIRDVSLPMLAIVKRSGFMIGNADGLIYHDSPQAKLERMVRTTPDSISFILRLIDACETDPNAWSSADIRELRRDGASSLTAIRFFLWANQMDFRRQGYDPVALFVRSTSVARRLRWLRPYDPILVSKPFPDVSGDHWAFQAIQGLKVAGLIVGYPSGKFAK